MNLLEAFKSFLFSQNNKPAKVTIKNYLSDVNHFIRWYENIYQKRLSPSNITAQVIKDYKEANISGLSASSMERHLSSLRKFFSFLKLEGQMTHSPFEELAGLNKKVDDDPWHLKDFKNYLYVCNASHLTIKNYIIDIKQFFTWAQASTAFDENATANSQDVLGTIDSKLVEEYKKRLLNEGSFSPATINRKLSSLRKYSTWAQGEGLIKGMDLPVPNAELPAKETAEAPMFIPFATEAIEIPKIKEYSKFPPIRLMQKMGEAISLGVDNSLIIPLANLISKTEYLVWKTKGKQVFTAASTSGLKLKAQNEKLKSYLVSHKPLVVKSFSKEFYAPHKISTKYFPFYKKVLFHARYTRPNWYKTYHSYAITHYFHFAVLIIFLVSISFGFFNAFVQKPQSQNPALATGPTAPPRVLSFQEKLTDNNNNPITTPTYLRFIVYNDMAASGSARLWEEVDRVNPDPDGIFNVTLGNGAVCNSGNPPSSPAAGACAIPQSLFAQGSTLWVGVTIGATPELTPRQQLATAAYATNAETLQGLSPITQAGTGTSNVVLALDSSGNLTIGDSANPTFQAIGGQFTLSGQPLFLTTNQGSNANVTISADGLGKIALDKPLTNTSFSNNIPSAAGSVEVDDLFSVLATSSGQSALTINQTSTGPLISASTSGIAKFTVDSSGNVTAAGGLTSSGNFLQNGVTTFKTGTGLVSINGNLNTNLIPNTALNLGSSGNNWGRIYGTTFYGGNNAGLTLGTASCVKTNGGIVIGSGPCPGGSNSSGPFAEITASGVIVPNNSAEDFLIGGQSFTSAKFALLNIAGARGTQLASLSGSLTLDSATASIQTTKNQLLTLGGSTTGNIQFKPGNSSTSLYLNSNGNVGIGTTTPRTTLDVVGNSLATASAFIENSNTQSGTVGLALKMGATSPDTSTHFVNFLDTNGNIVGDIRFATSSTIAYQTNGIADFAEYLKKDPSENIDWGSVLCENSTGNVEPCTSGSTHIIGVASQFPSFVGGKDLGDSSITVGLQGVVLTNVSNANGNIQAGDFVTSSQTPGVGVKATTEGQVVGIALQDYNELAPTEVGQIHIRVGPSWYNPDVYLTNTGNLNLVDNNASDSAYTIPHYFSLNDALGNPITKVGTFLELAVGNLKAGFISAQQISTNALSVASENMTINGMGIRNYIAGIVTQVINNTNGSYLSPIAEIDQLHTNFISPVDNNAQIGIKIDNNKVSILNGNTASSSAVATIDNQGNASFSGTLNSNALSVNNDATVSGTLHAGKIIADDIVGLNIKASTVSANYITNNVTNIYNSSPSSSFPTLLASASNDSSNPSVFSSLFASNNFINIATFSSSLAYVDNLNAGNAAFAQGLMVFGPTTLSDTSIVGQLSVNGNLILADNSINVLGSDLNLQPLRQGGLSIMGGLVYIDTNGNLRINGDTTINGALYVNLISPIPGNDLSLRLGTSSASYAPNLNVKNASGAAVLTVNPSGDLVASGAATFSKLNLNLIQPALAVSATEVIATGSAGTTSIGAHKTEITIDNRLVTKNSLIYITPTSNTNNQVLFLQRQVPGQSFTVGIANGSNTAIPFNWIIVN